MRAWHRKQDPRCLEGQKYVRGRCVPEGKGDASTGQLASTGGLLVPDQGVAGPEFGRRRRRRRDALDAVLRQFFMVGKAESPTSFQKVDEELQIVWGEVYSPGTPDSQGDFMSPDEVRKMAYRFLGQGRTVKIDVQHDSRECGAVVVESFIARSGDPDFIPGSWVIATHIPDPELWQAVKSGKLNGFSMAGKAIRNEQKVEVAVPEEVSGTTMGGGRGEHRHEFTVRINEDGSVVGETGPPLDLGIGDTHVHEIRGGTVTEPAAATGTSETHVHRFSVNELIMEQALGTLDDLEVEGTRRR